MLYQCCHEFTHYCVMEYKNLKQKMLPSPHSLHYWGKKVHSFFFGVIGLGGVWRGGGVHVSGGRGLHGVSEGGGGDLSYGLSQPGGKSC